METPNFLQEVIFKKKYRILRHILFWLFIYADEVMSFIGLTEFMDIPSTIIGLELLGDMALIYINIYYLLPRFFLKGKIFTYAILTISTIGLVMWFNFELFDLEIEENYLGSYIISELVTHFGLISMAVALKFVQQTFESKEKIKNLREENLKTELAYLKTQVNPHFLFNTLNNIYVMAQKQDEKVPDTVLHLSDLLRYQLYDCEGETVPLSKELEYLNNYIDLEKLRRQDIDIKFDIVGDVISKSITPLLLLPFIENAFKYSNTGGVGRAFIHIHLELKENDLIFKCENNIGSLKASEVGGIGLTNATRRLELAYPKTHDLKIDKLDNVFKVNLTLKDI